MENKQLKADAQNRLVRAEERHREEREEWMTRKEQMEEVIKSLNSQVEVNLDRAKAALVSDPQYFCTETTLDNHSSCQVFARSTEQKLRLADREITKLNNIRYIEWYSNMIYKGLT